MTKNQHEIPTSFSVPTAIRHSFTLSDGRTLSYNNFFDDSSPKYHPVLYIHGFPGTGLEGSLCAEEVNKAGGALYAVDRPGFGYSDPYPSKNKDDPDARVSCFCDSIWEMVSHLKWKSFSIIGVSGGGPYTLALLDSYLSKLNSSDTPPIAKIEAVSLVAGIYCPAGVDDILDASQTLYKLVTTNSTWSNFQLKTMFAVPNILIKILPTSIMKRMIPIKELPVMDQEIMDDPEVARFMLTVLAQALRQGSSAAVLETHMLFRSQYGFEESLKNNCDTENMTRVSLFQGLQDVNVAPSHSSYVHKEIFKERSELHTFRDLGHVSLVAKKASEYALAAMPPKE